MGRGRQKAKQQKIARKLKYLTTDTDYDELAKELGAQEPGSGSFDPFADIETKYARTANMNPPTMSSGLPSLPMISMSMPSGPPKPRRRPPAVRFR